MVLPSLTSSFRPRPSPASGPLPSPIPPYPTPYKSLAPALPPPRPKPRTISSALHHANLVNPPAAYAEWAPYLRVTRRFLGEPPSFYPVLSLSPAAIRTHVGLFARFFHCPQIDLRLPGFPTPELRRLAFVSASDAFHCDYCTVHAFSFGDLIRGSVPEQVRRGRGDQAHTPITPDAPGLSDVQRAVIRYARAAVERPYVRKTGVYAPSLHDLAADVQKHIGARATEVLGAVICFCGALNTVTDFQGVMLEAEIQSFAHQHLPTPHDCGDDFAANDHHRNDGDGNAVGRWQGEDPALMGLKGRVENLKLLLGTIPPAVHGMKYELFVLYDGIPMRTAKLYRWLDDRLGGGKHCAWFRELQGTELKRAFCFSLRENLLVEDSRGRCWTPSARICFLYLFARVVKSEPLAEIAVALAPTGILGGDDAAPRRELIRFVRCASDELFPSVAMGRRLVYAAAVKMANISPDLVEECTEACSPEALMELASLLSFFEMWRRLVLLFTPKDGKHIVAKPPRNHVDSSLECPIESPLQRSFDDFDDQLYSL